jgi:hypothetical protein
MNREDIIRMAREAGFEVYGTDVWITDGWWTEELERFAALVAAAERSACVKVCEDMDHNGVMIAADCAAAIRARGQE